jgi:hypothetical protein
MFDAAVDNLYISTYLTEHQLVTLEWTSILCAADHKLSLCYS